MVGGRLPCTKMLASWRDQTSSNFPPEQAHNRYHCVIPIPTLDRCTQPIPIPTRPWDTTILECTNTNELIQINYQYRACMYGTNTHNDTIKQYKWQFMTGAHHNKICESNFQMSCIIVVQINRFFVVVMFAMFSNSPLLLVAADLVPRQSRDKILSCFLKPQLFSIFMLKSNNSVTLTERTDRHSGFKRSKHPSLSSLSTLSSSFPCRW